ncbi:hypothetical protein T12_10816 [Trichinella patagoniensis]|uniref:Uncharacterized protein n=1 Tax=Trichinella patagoniensis TaxID=990121 RepID=A0A0V1AD31_9BILA|nr:hypothetical protein T12_10816 [Trichinella patagoniensis]
METCSIALESVKYQHRRGPDDVQAVLGIALTGGCTSWTSFAEKAENG